MKILKIEPGKSPVEMEIDGSLESMQSVVGGMIQAVFPFHEEVALICNEEGKLTGLPYNRTLRMEETNEIYDIICGTCFLCGVPVGGEHFTSLTPEQLQKYTAYYKQPELFMKIGNRLIVIKNEEDIYGYNL